jgi:hypothetical protein
MILIPAVMAFNISWEATQLNIEVNLTLRVRNATGCLMGCNVSNDKKLIRMILF